MDFQTEQMTSVWIHLLWMQLIQRAIVLFISQNLEGFIRFCPGLTVNCLFQKVVPIFWSDVWSTALFTQIDFSMMNSHVMFVEF